MSSFQVEAELREQVRKFSTRSTVSSDEIGDFAERFLSALESGAIRAANKLDTATWHANEWVKTGILLLFRYGHLVQIDYAGEHFFDKHLLPPQRIQLCKGVRLVPGGSAVRRGAYLAPGVICMPPMYINVGAYIDEGTMVDSHVLVGTCAQIGKRVHLSAGAQIGGVLEPASARPVIIEDDAFIGGNTGIYEGVLVHSRAVIGAGVILTASIPLYDLVHEQVITSTATRPLEVPPGAVVIPGTRLLSRSPFAKAHGLAAACAIIVKYRDERTDAHTALESSLRM